MRILSAISKPDAADDFDLGRQRTVSRRLDDASLWRSARGIHAIQMELACRSYMDEPATGDQNNWPPDIMREAQADESARASERHAHQLSSAYAKERCRMTRIDNSRIIKPATGDRLTAKSWLTEAPLRMIMNNLHPDVAERPEELVVYGGIGRAARDWESFDRIVATLKRLEDDRDASGSIGQAGRRIPHPCKCAARPDREFQSRARIGRPGTISTNWIARV